MTHTIRLIVIFIANTVLMTGMLIWLSLSGIDIQKSTIADNADSMKFMFDFLAFIVAGLSLNVFLLSIPSNTKTAINKMLMLIESTHKESSKPIRKHNKRQTI